MSPLWRYYLPGYILALPLTLVGILLLAYYRPRSVYWNSGCFEFVMRDGKYLIGGPWVGGQTFGNIIYYRDDRSRSDPQLRGHERVHTWQAMAWTAPGLAISYGLSALWNIGKIRKDLRMGYRNILAEKQAYKISWEIEVDPDMDFWGKEL